MRKTIWASMFAVAAFAVGSEARADWGLHTGDVMRPGDNMLYGEVGWPDLTVGFQHGVSDKVDVGFRFSLLYGYDYTTFTQLGIGMRVPIRITPVRRDKFSFQFHFDPGLKFDAFNPLQFGLWLPLGLEFGIHIVREATLSFGMEMPLFINFTNGVYGSIPLLFGPGFEYHIDDHIAVGLNLKFGPSIRAQCVGQDANGNCVDQSGAVFGFITQANFAYRL
jgi:hypothetical protein